MNLYAELVDNSQVGSTVRVFYKNGKLVASKNSSEGYLGLIKTLRGKVAFITITNENTPNLASSAGGALGIKIDLPISTTGRLSITTEE